MGIIILAAIDFCREQRIADCCTVVGIILRHIGGGSRTVALGDRPTAGTITGADTHCVRSIRIVQFITSRQCILRDNVRFNFSPAVQQHLAVHHRLRHFYSVREGSSSTRGLVDNGSSVFVHQIESIADIGTRPRHDGRHGVLLRIVIQPVLIRQHSRLIRGIAACGARTFHRAGQIDIVAENLFILGNITHVPGEGLGVQIVGEMLGVDLAICQDINAGIRTAVSLRTVPVKGDSLLDSRRIALTGTNHRLSNRDAVHCGTNLVLLIELVGTDGDGGGDRLAIRGKRSDLQVIGFAHHIGEGGAIAGLFDICGNLVESVVQIACAVRLDVIAAVRGNFLQDILHGGNCDLLILRKAETDGIHLGAQARHLSHIRIGISSILSLVDDGVLAAGVTLDGLRPPVFITVAVVEIAVASTFSIITCAL